MVIIESIVKSNQITLCPCFTFMPKIGTALLYLRHDFFFRVRQGPTLRKKIGGARFLRYHPTTHPPQKASLGLVFFFFGGHVCLKLRLLRCVITSYNFLRLVFYSFLDLLILHVCIMREWPFPHVCICLHVTYVFGRFQPLSRCIGTNMLFSERSWIDSRWSGESDGTNYRSYWWRSNILKRKFS